MKKRNDHLLKIGEAAKIVGITRKTILNYEELGLVIPAVKDESSGFRYYTVDNVMQMRSIRSLQSLGLSLKEVAAYYYDTRNMDDNLRRLMELRSMLDRNIQMLQVRSAKQGDLTVHRITLPRQICFCQRTQSRDVPEAANRLRDTYIAANRSGHLSRMGRMFTVRMTPVPEELDLLCCIPVDDAFDGAERVEFLETPALCIYYRGPYEGTGTAIQALHAYAQAHQITLTGGFRSIYLEGPPNRGDHSEDYITQVAVPIQDPS